MPKMIVDLLKAGTEANNSDKFRHANLVMLPGRGSIVITGDIHGNRRNFEKITAFADLGNNPERHLILQEIIHGGKEDAQGGCLSFELLFDVIRFKLLFPDRVHLIMGNHDTAYINNSEVMKGGKEMNQAMRSAMKRRFADQCDAVDLALRQFFFSQPLAVKCENRVWISHSLPADRFVDDFEPSIFNRQLKVSDVVRPNSAYLLTWGRNHKQEAIDKLAGLLDADLFVLGHQAQEKGFAKAGKNVVIIASDHAHGCLMQLDLSRRYTADELLESIIMLATVN